MKLQTPMRLTKGIILFLILLTYSVVVLGHQQAWSPRLGARKGGRTRLDSAYDIPFAEAFSRRGKRPSLVHFTFPHLSLSVACNTHTYPVHS
jgi:hypothetical protein